MGDTSTKISILYSILRLQGIEYFSYSIKFLINIVTLFCWYIDKTEARDLLFFNTAENMADVNVVRTIKLASFENALEEDWQKYSESILKCVDTCTWNCIEQNI